MNLLFCRNGLPLFALNTGPRRLKDLHVFHIYSHIRLLSTKDVFGTTKLEDLLPSVPSLPIPTPKISIYEMMQSGQSVLDEIGLWAPYRPSSYLRWALESLHYWTDTPWWMTIIIGNLIIGMSILERYKFFDKNKLKTQFSMKERED